ncbi:Protein SGM1 [Nakaseomyces bracarensis]|uniref:Protein SGM1 n=1 Tax=Nakaseomyces bracarensis TaxID=273131 RepID=A0ABR4NT08_9SACH
MSESKKLSLEERLNLAAQKRRRPKKNVPTTEDVGSVTASNSKESLVDVVDSELDQWIPADISGIDRTELIKILDQHIIDFKQNFKSTKSNNDSSVLKLVKGKDEEIDQLKKAVEKYKRNEEVSTLQLGKFKEAIEEIRSTRDQLGIELDETLREKDDLIAKLKDSEKNFELKSDELKISGDLQIKIKDIEQKLISERENTSKLIAENQALKLKLDNQKSEFRDEQEKNNKLSNELITSLESQLEQLRIELENKSDEQSKDTGNKNTSYTLLKEQFQSSKSNWSSIESILNSKINTLEDSVEGYKQKVKKLQTQLETKTSVLANVEHILEEEKSLKREIENKYESLEKDFSVNKHELENLKEDYNLLEKKYETQRKNYKKEPGTQELGPSSIDTAANDWNDFRAELDPINDIEGHIDSMSIERGSVSGRVDSSNMKTQDMIDLDKNSFVHSKDSEIDFPEDADALEEMNFHDRSFRRLSTQPSNSGQTNTHLVTKLGNEIRRLENEIISLNEKIERLQKEKSSANEEILKLIEKNNEYNSVNSEKELLEKEVKELEGKLDTTLQILGEKTERVDELQNDVLDLKDMLREQVKQMIDLQEKIR